MASTAGAGSLSTMNARPIKHARVVRDLGHIEAALGQRPVIARPTSKYLPPSPRSGPGRPRSVTQRNHRSSIVPQNGARRRHHWNVDHHRTVGEIDEAPEVDGVGVRRQEQRRRVLGYMWPRITAEPWSAPPSASPSPWWCWRWGWRCPGRLPGRRPDSVLPHDAAAVAYDTIVRFMRRSAADNSSNTGPPPGPRRPWLRCFPP
jgi:hypothetical protein